MEERPFAENALAELEEQGGFRSSFARAVVCRLAGELAEELAPAALGLAISRGLTVYDACYAVLAEAEDTVLVTADRRLVAAVSRAELV